MIYYYFNLALLLVFFVLLFYVIQKELRTEKRAISYLLICSALTIIFKYNWGIPFWGLEYEDAYAFSFCARQFGYDIYPSSFLVDAVTIGSLQEPIAIGTYGGHFITYPTFLSIFVQSFGWSYNILCIANCLVSFLIMLLLSFMFKASNNWFVAPITYCCAPIINVFTTCMLSETFSSFICLVFIFAYFRKESNAVVFLKLIAFFLALLCKRENLVLCLLPALDSLQVLFNKDNYSKRLKQTITIVAPYALIILVYFLLIQNVLEIERIEAADIGMPTFSITYFVRLFPAFIKSLFSLTAFSVTTIVCFVILCWHLRKKKNYNKRMLYPLALFFMYLILYSSHYRGWFFIQGEEVSEFETYRYIINFYYLLLLSVGVACYILPKKVIGVLLLLIGFSIYQTKNSREYYSHIEEECRFDEVNEVLDFINKEKPDAHVMLICDNILLYQNLCADDFCVCDSRDINTLEKGGDFSCYFVVSDLDYLRKRYGVSIDNSKFEKRRTLRNGNVIYKMY